jgi:hypothetical protein
MKITAKNKTEKDENRYKPIDGRQQKSTTVEMKEGLTEKGK